MNKLITKIVGAALGLTMAVGVGVGVAVGSSKEAVPVNAADGTTHSITGFTGEGTGTLVNNGATPSAITVTDPGYAIKQVIIGWKHNKSNDGITATVTVGGDSLGSGKVGGSNTTSTTTIGDGNTSLSGAVNITWTNDMTGTGKGTLYINTLTFVEGTASDTYTVSFNNNGGSGTMSDVNDVYGSYTLPACTFTAPNGQVFAGWKANNTGSIIAVGGTYTVNDDVTFYAQWATAYIVTYSAGTNGSGSYAHTSQPAGTYTLLPFASLTGVSANSNYRFANYTVGGTDYDPGDTITLSAATSVTVNFEEIPLETTYDFTANFSTYASSWSGYGTHEGLAGVGDIGGDYAATIDLYMASKQGNTMTDRPVFATKTASGSWTKVLQFTLTESGYKIDTITVTFAQWTTKTPDVSLWKGTSASGTALDTATIGTKNTLSASDFNGTTFTIGYCDKNSSSNVQAGLTSIYITLAPLASFGTLDHITITSLPNVVYHVGETFDATGLTVTAYDAADEDTANFKDVTSSVVTDLDDPDPFVDGDVPGFDCDVQYTGDGGTDTKSFHVYVYALAEYELVTEDLTDWSGQYLIVGTDSNSDLVALNGGVSHIDEATNYKVVTATNNVISSGQELEWTITAVSGGYSIQGKSGKYIGSLTSANNGMLISDSAVVNTLSNSNGDVTITGTNNYTMKFQTSADRFRYYSGSNTVQLYKLVQSDNADAYAQTFLGAFTCDATGENEPTFAIKEGSTYWSWSLLATEYDTLTSVEKEQFRLGVASESGSNIEQALARYDYIVAKYGTSKYSNFMNRTITPLSSSSIALASVIGNTGTTVSIIVVVSLVSLTAIGGYFFLKKRKEQ